MSLEEDQAYHEDAVVVKAGLRPAPQLLALAVRRRGVCGGAWLGLLLLGPPVIRYSLQHQLSLLADQRWGGLNSVLC